MHILDLPIEEQKRIAKEWGETDFEAWQEELRQLREQTEKELAEMEAYKPTKAEIAEKIERLRTNPWAIHFYRRVSDNYELTVEEVVRNLESVETID